MLRRHHTRHGWLYCARCLMTTFNNVDERKLHKDSANCAFKCVTTYCPEYGTFPRIKCAHANGYPSDSGEAVWQELFRTYRPRDIVPNPRVQGHLGACHSTILAETSHPNASSPPMSPLQRDAPPLQAWRGQTALLPNANAPPTIEPFSPMSTRTRVFTSLAELLWPRINTQNPTPSTWVRRLYQLATELPRRPPEDTEADHAAPVLEHFVHQLWRVSNREVELTTGLYNELQTFARLWIRSTDCPSLQPTLSDLTNTLTLAQTDPATFDGVGDQALRIFQPDSVASPPPAPDPQQPVGHHSRSHTFQGQDAYPRTSLQTPAVVEQNRQIVWQSSAFGPQVNTNVYSHYAISRRNTRPENMLNSQGTLSSRSRSSIEHLNTPSTNPRHASNSTNPTSITRPFGYHADSQNIEKPPSPDLSLDNLLAGPSTRPLSPSSWTNFSQNFGDDTFSWDWEWNSTLE